MPFRGTDAVLPWQGGVFLVHMRFATRLHHADDALYRRWLLPVAVTVARRRCWLLVTHLGGTMASVGAATLPLLAGGRTADAAAFAFEVLALSHILVQLLKRTIGRPRPRVPAGRMLHIPAPDRFSFPSGHAAAAMSVALGYGLAFPELAPVLLPLAVLVGFSRVCLGVHYPGDVLAGQALAVLTAVGIRVLG